MIHLNKNTTLKKRILAVLLILGISSLWLSHTVRAQEELPADYKDPNRVVSLKRSLPFQQAIQILNGFAQKFANRFILDKTGTTGPIGVNLPPMNWKRALNYIVEAKGLQLVYTEEAIEIQKPQEKQPPGKKGARVQAAGQKKDLPGLHAREVRIEATFFEGNKQAIDQVGVDWSTLTSQAPAATGGTGTGFGVQNRDQEFVRVNARGAQNVSQNLFSSLINFGEVGAGVSVQALFSAFEQDNLGQIIARPTIKVLEGNQGKIHVGQSFSIKQKTFSGNITEKFFDVGTILTVTPYIIEKGDSTFIYMTLKAERSSAQPTGASAIINQQTATTNITLLDGESTVIAGLYRTEKSVTRQGVPILKDLPPWFLGLRYIFGFNSTTQIVRELVILIEASIEPSLPQRMASDEKMTTPVKLREERKEFEKMMKPTGFDLGEKKPIKQTIFESTKLEYHIIGGSYKDKKKAVDHRRKLEEKGYNAKIIDKPNSELYLVSYFSAGNATKADYLLDDIKKNVNKEAWIYKMTQDANKKDEQ